MCLILYSGKLEPILIQFFCCSKINCNNNQWLRKVIIHKNKRHITVVSHALIVYFITGYLTVCLSACSHWWQRRYQSFALLALCEAEWSMIIGFQSHRPSDAERVFMAWCDYLSYPKIWSWSLCLWMMSQNRTPRGCSSCWPQGQSGLCHSMSLPACLRSGQHISTIKQLEMSTGNQSLDLNPATLSHM